MSDGGSMARAGIDIRLLGPVGASADGQEIEVGGPKERAVLALLASDPTAPRTQDSLIDRLWDDDPPKTARKTLQTYVAHVRRAFDAVGAGEMIVTGPAGYSLSAAARTDLEEVEALMARAQRCATEGAPATATDALTVALDLFGDDPLGGAAPSRSIDALAESYRQLRWNLVEDLARARLAAGGDATLATDLHRWVDANPYREGLWAASMLTLYRAGQQAAALASFQRARRNLVDGLGVEPGPELQDLEKAILRQDPELLEPGGRRALGARTETLTFMFTDIERSTVHWDVEPDAMQSALPVHERVVRARVADHDGWVFAEGGDGFGAAFARAEDAARAAIGIQHDHTDTQWPTAEPLRVRIGLHTGTAEARGENYFGTAVNRAARVMDSGHGGQVLCSGSAAALLVDLDPADGNLCPLGEFPLKGLTRPEQLHQLSADGLDQHFPPIATPAAAEPGLPTPLDSLHGRAAELDDVGALIADHRLVTLTGVGGTGKTRLALEAAHRLREVYGDGVIWVELATVDESGIVAAVAGAIGMALSGPEENRHTYLLAALRERHALLVLDNCEHLLGTVGSFAEQVLRATERVTIVTTSREPLGVAGERIYVVPSLDVTNGPATSPAASLLVDRAVAAGAQLSNDESEQTALREICARLDGLPLALEIAGAHLATIRPPELLERLDDHFRLLPNRGRGGIARQQTIDAAMDWSYRLLEPAEQGFLCRLSVFRGGFDEPAAQAIAAHDLDEPAFALIDRLRRASLLNILPNEGEAVTRYKLLEPVRQFADARFRLTDEVPDTYRRHATHFLERFRRDRTGDRFDREAVRFDGIARDDANVRQAAEILADDDPVGFLELFDAMLTFLAIGSLNHGPLTSKAISILAERRVDDLLVAAHAYNALAMLEGFRGDEAAILGYLSSAQDIAARSGDDTLRAETEFHLGSTAIDAGRVDDAVRHLTTSTSLHDRLDNLGTLSINLAWLGSALALAGRAIEALPVVGRAELLAREHDTGKTAVFAAMAFVAQQVSDAEMLERAIAVDDLPAIPYRLLAALLSERRDDCLDEACNALRVRAGTDVIEPYWALLVAVTCRRVGEERLAALWTAQAVAQREVRRRRSTNDSPGLLASIDRFLPAEERLEPMAERSRALLGTRFDALVVEYEATLWAIARQTISALEAHRASPP